MNKHVEAAAKAIAEAFDVSSDGLINPYGWEAEAQAAYNAIVESLASAGEDGVVEAAAAPFMHFLAMMEAKPMRGAADEFYAIHVGTEWEARLSLSQFRELRAALAVARLNMSHGWLDGTPPNWFDEWFIAETIHGDRVVLQALPEEYAYDYETADRTFYKAATIKRWMQFPDSQFKPLNAVARAADAQRLAELERDAARYRWLRERGVVTRAAKDSIVETQGGALLDRRIDAARAQEGGAK